MNHLSKIIATLVLILGWIPGLTVVYGETDSGMVFQNQPVTIKIATTRPGQDQAARSACQQELQRIESTYAVRIQGSKVNHLNQYAARKPVVVDQETMALLTWGKSLSTLSQGHFDVTTAAYLWQYGFGQKNYRVPSQLTLDQMKPLVGNALIVLDHKDQIVLFKRDGVQLTLDPLLNNYAFAQLSSILKQYQVKVAGISIGQNFLAFGTQPEGRLWQHQLRTTWKTALSLPTLTFRQGQVLVADTYSHSFQKKGQRYPDIVDPKTGLPCNYSKMAVLFSPKLTRVTLVPAVLLSMRPEEAVALVDKTRELACLVIDSQGKSHKSKSWFDYVQP